jgi:hypothetical protein
VLKDLNRESEIGEDFSTPKCNSNSLTLISSFDGGWKFARAASFEIIFI